MNVLVLGSGAREHAICLKIKESKFLDKLFIIPGNSGTKELGENINGDILDFEFINKICLEKNINFIIPGSETPLVNGIVDYFEINNKNIKIFGPNKLAAKLEGSKCFSKNILEKYSIPTAKFKNFKETDINEINNFINAFLNNNKKFVIKVDGLAQGKGVFIVSSREETEKILDMILNKKIFKNSAKNIVIEEFLEGYEVSSHVFINGNQYKILPFSQDHKQVFDNDSGPNTGGMGAFAPCPLVDESLAKKIEKEIIIPIIQALEKEKISYHGVLYIGLMICGASPFVLEFNVRFGDPETQVILPILNIDLLEIMNIIANNDKKNFEKFEIINNNNFAVCLTLASRGYPNEYEKGKIININYDKLDNKNTIIFHAGTKLTENNELVTNGGRVISLMSKGNTLNEARAKVYEEVKNIDFDGMHYRKDIAFRKNLRRFL